MLTCDFNLLPYIKSKIHKTAVTVGPGEKWISGSELHGRPWKPYFGLAKDGPEMFTTDTNRDRKLIWHSLCTASTSCPQRITSRIRGKLSLQRFSQFIQQPIQIFITLARLLDLVDRVHDSGVVLTPKLAAYLGQGSLRKMFGQIHGYLPRIHDGARVVLSLDLP